MTELLIAVRIPGSQEEWLSIDFGEGGYERIVSVGSNPSCNVRLTASGVAPLHAFLAAGSNHRFVEYVHAEDGYEAYEVTRVDDRSFPIGPFQLRFVSSLESRRASQAETPPRSRWSELLDRILGLPPIEEPEIEEPETLELGPFPYQWLGRGSLEPAVHPRGAMGLSRRLEIQLNDPFRAELEDQSRRSGQTPSAYASTCLEIEFHKPSARARRTAAENCHGTHRYELFASRSLVERLQKNLEPPLSLEQSASRIVATRLVRRAEDESMKTPSEENRR